MEAEVQQIEFNLEKLFKYLIAKKNKLPQLNEIIAGESKKELIEVQQKAKKNATECHVKPFVVIPHCIAIEILSSKKKKPFDIFPTF